MGSYTVWYARVAGAATIFFAAGFVVFLVIQPDLNPLYRFGSEYAVGRMGWLMKVSFFVWGTGLFALALAMAYGLDSAAKSQVAIILFIVASIGIFLSGIFDSDLQVLNESPPPRWIEAPPTDEQKLHAIGGVIAFFSLMPGAGLVSRRLRIAGRLSGGYRWLRPLSWSLPVAFLAFATVFIPQGYAGLGQRIFLLLVFTWVIVAARGLEKGTFLRLP